MALESQKYHHLTQNQKLHRIVSLDFFRTHHFTFIHTNIELVRFLTKKKFKFLTTNK